jgi:hypothetical protein
MKVYAHIKDNKIINTVVFKDQPEFQPEEGYFVDITDLKPRPGIDWRYDQSNNSFLYPTEEEEEEKQVFLHIQTNKNGILNNGKDRIDVVMSLRKGRHPESELVSVSDTWQLIIRNQEDQVYDIVEVEFINGVCEFSYQTDNIPAVCTINEEDLKRVQINDDDYQVKIVNKPMFRIYRKAKKKGIFRRFF